MFGSDFPHIDHAADIVGSATALPIGRERLAKVLWESATTLLGVS
jgi:predicted TIM-barrel fold metal-dependent hydrolase